MTIRQAFFLVPLALLPIRLDAAVVIPDDVDVRVYDSAGLPPRLVETALAVARATLAAANVQVGWQRCPASSACAVPAAAGRALVLRLVTGTADARGTGASAALRSRHGLPLGDAFVDTGRRTGVLATIYADRVLLLAGSAGTDPATLLGHAIAHEIGHLLLASNAHGTRGLMRPLWDRADLRRARERDWQFTPEEARAMRRRLDARP
jgi:hypothetical protein